MWILTLSRTQFYTSGAPLCLRVLIFEFTTIETGVLDIFSGLIGVSQQTMLSSMGPVCIGSTLQSVREQANFKDHLSVTVKTLTNRQKRVIQPIQHLNKEMRLGALLKYIENAEYVFLVEFVSRTVLSVVFSLTR